MKRLHASVDRRSSIRAIRMLFACALALSCLQSVRADAGAIEGAWQGSYQCPLPTDLTLIIRHTGPREVVADFVFQAHGTPQRLAPGDFPMKGTYDEARKRVLLIPGTPRTMPPGFRTVRVTGNLIDGRDGEPGLSVRLASCAATTLSRVPDVTAAEAYEQYASGLSPQIAAQQSKDTPPAVAESTNSRAEQRQHPASKPPQHPAPKPEHLASGPPQDPGLKPAHDPAPKPAQDFVLKQREDGKSRPAQDLALKQLKDRESQPDADARKKEIRKAQLEAEYAQQYALLAQNYSARENQLMAAPGRLPLIVPESYTEPDEEEIGLTMMREMTAGGGRMLTPHSIEVGVPPFDIFMPIQLDSARVEKEECRRLESSPAYSCRFRHYLKVSLPARSWEFLGLGGKNEMFNDLVQKYLDKVNETTPGVIAHVFVLTENGWRSPTMREQSIQASLDTYAETFSGWPECDLVHEGGELRCE